MLSCRLSAMVLSKRLLPRPESLQNTAAEISHGKGGRGKDTASTITHRPLRRSPTFGAFWMFPQGVLHPGSARGGALTLFTFTNTLKPHPRPLANLSLSCVIVRHATKNPNPASLCASGCRTDGPSVLEVSELIKALNLSSADCLTNRWSTAEPSLPKEDPWGTSTRPSCLDPPPDQIHVLRGVGTQHLPQLPRGAQGIARFENPWPFAFQRANTAVASLESLANG